jgi:hypothetical protein
VQRQNTRSGFNSPAHLDLAAPAVLSPPESITSALADASLDAGGGIRRLAEVDLERTGFPRLPRVKTF